MTPFRDTFPSVLEACFLVFALLLVEFLIAGVMLSYKSQTGLEMRDLWGFITIVGNGVLFSVLLHFKRQPYADLFHASSNSIAGTLGVVALPIAMLVPGMLVLMSALQYLLLMLFPMSTADQMMFDSMMTSGLGSLVTVCLIAPVVEEMLFRGVILRSFLNQYSRSSAIFGSALIFGIAHMNVYQFFAGLGTGIVLGWLYECTQSLWPCILFHASYNSAITWLYFVDSEAGGNDPWMPSPALAAGMLVTGLVGALFLRRFLTPAGSAQ